MSATTIAVDPVEHAAAPLREIAYRKAITLQLLGPLMQEQAPIARLKQASAALQGSIEGSSDDHPSLVASFGNPLVETIHHCYAEHRRLVLSPDTIWLQICHGVAIHINNQAEQLRAQFVDHAGKRNIVVIRNDFIKGGVNPWYEAIGEFGAQVDALTRGARRLFTPSFSTTSLTEQVAAEIVLLAAMQHYADYTLVTLCGIPEITLEGKLADWQQLAERAQTFAQYDLDWWIAPLLPVLQQFVAAKRGSIDQQFWRSIYKLVDDSGGPHISGWILALFPYLNDKMQQPRTRNPALLRPVDERQRILSGQGRAFKDFEGATSGDFPSGLCTAPFIWSYLGQEFSMRFDAGFIGIQQNAATLALRPAIGWCVRDASAE
jgi:hypothetical protein